MKKPNDSITTTNFREWTLLDSIIKMGGGLLWICKLVHISDEMNNGETRMWQETQTGRGRPVCLYLMACVMSSNSRLRVGGGCIYKAYLAAGFRCLSVFSENCCAAAVAAVAPLSSTLFFVFIKCKSWESNENVTCVLKMDLKPGLSRFSH